MAQLSQEGVTDRQLPPHLREEDFPSAWSEMCDGALSWKPWALWSMPVLIFGSSQRPGASFHHPGSPSQVCFPVIQGSPLALRVSSLEHTEVWSAGDIVGKKGQRKDLGPLWDIFGRSGHHSGSQNPSGILRKPPVPERNTPRGPRH